MRSLLLMLSLLIASCSMDSAEYSVEIPSDDVSETTAAVSPSSESFGDYWYQGLAEITTYDLEQVRYGEVRQGEAVLIFVTEPFSRSRHVKLNVAGESPEEEVTVLKLNHTRDFVTGVYPYSMMTSAFTPVSEGPFPLKVTASSQEWCGHTFTQLNRSEQGEQGFRVRLFSYFENEGDQDGELPDVFPEDGIWNLIRINPDALPTGNIQMIPGALFQRMSHMDLQPYSATASVTRSDSTHVYRVEYPDLDRILAITFNADHPHEISRWEEARMSGFGEGGQMLTTSASVNAREMLPYWQLNGTEDEHYRAALGLE